MDAFRDAMAEESHKVNPLSPAYYEKWVIQPLDFIVANNLDFLRGNVIKYIMRYEDKNGLEDLKKAKVYLERLITKCVRDSEKPV